MSTGIPVVGEYYYHTVRDIVFCIKTLPYGSYHYYNDLYLTYNCRPATDTEILAARLKGEFSADLRTGV